MRRARTNMAFLLLLLFCCYYSGISMFSHVHIVHGSSIVHSHLGGGAEHDHSDSQYAVIDILSDFQSEGAVHFHDTGSPLMMISESRIAYEVPDYRSRTLKSHTLRGPPQC